MKKTLIGLLVLMMVSGFVALGHAAPDNPVSVTVRVTITSALEITVVSGELIDFGSMAPGVSAVVDEIPTVIKNTGSGVTQTYKMIADSPVDGLTAGAAPDHNVYVLQAAFHDIEPAAGVFGSEDTLVEDTEITASGTVLSIDGSETGLSVPYNESRSIWYKFTPPSSSSVTTQQDITVTITAVTP